MRPFNVDERLQIFLESLAGIEWFAHAGEPSTEARTVPNIEEGWDGENTRVLSIWKPQTLALEQRAQSLIGDVGIDAVFAKVSAFIQDRLFCGVSGYFERRYSEPLDDESSLQGDCDADIFPDLLSAIKRDIAWAAVEVILGNPDFFAALLPWYKQGRWPCSWDGDYPEGRVVIL